MSDALDEVRRAYAARIAELAGVRSEALVRGLASVRREDFVGPGPWQLIVLAELARGYQTTPDADPRRLYANVLVALDPSRRLNNGEPAALARWLDQLELRPGERFVHLGCGVGYYTAIAAHAVAPGGTVLGIEVDAGLAARARANLAALAQVRVENGDGSRLAPGSADAIFVNAGATEPLPVWLDALAPGGRMLVPLTVSAPDGNLTIGWMLHVARHADRLTARLGAPVGIYPCSGARSAEGEAALRAAYARGGTERVRSLLREPHAPGPDCWLHAARFCLSSRTIG